jgi:hypothetical protein
MADNSTCIYRIMDRSSHASRKLTRLATGLRRTFPTTLRRSAMVLHRAPLLRRDRLWRSGGRTHF